MHFPISNIFSLSLLNFSQITVAFCCIPFHISSGPFSSHYRTTSLHVFTFHIYSTRQFQLLPQKRDGVSTLCFLSTGHLETVYLEQNTLINVFIYKHVVQVYHVELWKLCLPCQKRERAIKNVINCCSIRFLLLHNATFELTVGDLCVHTRHLLDYILFGIRNVIFKSGSERSSREPSRSLSRWYVVAFRVGGDGIKARYPFSG